MFLDIGIGILIAVVTSNISGVSLSFPWVILAIIFSLLPDVDEVYDSPHSS